MQKRLDKAGQDLFITWQSPADYRLSIALDLKSGSQITSELSSTEYGLVPESALLRISVCDFSASAGQLSTMCKWMQRIFVELPAFRIYLNNFSGIPPHLLYMRVQCTPEVLALRSCIDRLNQYLQRHDLPTVQQPDRWTLPVSNNLSGMDFDKALRYLANKQFTMQLNVRELVLEKQVHPGSDWQVVQRMPLQTQSFSNCQPWYAPCRH